MSRNTKVDGAQRFDRGCKVKVEEDFSELLIFSVNGETLPKHTKGVRERLPDGDELILDVVWRKRMTRGNKHGFYNRIPYVRIKQHGRDWLHPLAGLYITEFFDGDKQAWMRVRR